MLSEISELKMEENEIMHVIMKNQDKEKIYMLVEEDKIAVEITDRIINVEEEKFNHLNKIMKIGDIITNIEAFYIVLLGVVSIIYILIFLCRCFIERGLPMISKNEVYFLIAFVSITIILTLIYYIILKSINNKISNSIIKENHSDITRNEFEFLNDCLTEKKFYDDYSIVKKSENKVYYYKDNLLMIKGCMPDVINASVVRYCSYFELFNKYCTNEYSLYKLIKFTLDPEMK